MKHCFVIECSMLIKGYFRCPNSDKCQSRNLLLSQAVRERVVVGHFTTDVKSPLIRNVSGSCGTCDFLKAVDKSLGKPQAERERWLAIVTSIYNLFL